MITVTVKLYEAKELEKHALEKAHKEFLEKYDVMEDAVSEIVLTLKEGLSKIFNANLKKYRIDYYNAYSSTCDFSMDEDEIISLNDFKDKIKYFIKRDCPFTGVCWDEDFLMPIRKLLNEQNGQDETINLYELANDCVFEIFKAVEKEYEYRTSIEYFMDICEANEWFFFENGKRVPREIEKQLS